jgi:Tol biopolymer transport system component
VISGQQCSADNKNVIFGAQDGVWSVPIGGGAPTKLNLPSRQIGYSRDGKLMFYVSQEHANGVLHMSLVIVAADAPATVLHRFDVPFGMGQVRFTPDGKGLAYSLTRKGAANIWVQPLSGGEPYALTKFTSGDLFAFAWSSDGKQLALSHGRGKSDVVMISNFR